MVSLLLCLALGQRPPIPTPSEEAAAEGRLHDVDESDMGNKKLPSIGEIRVPRVLPTLMGFVEVRYRFLKNFSLISMFPSKL